MFLYTTNSFYFIISSILIKNLFFFFFSSIAQMYKTTIYTRKITKNRKPKLYKLTKEIYTHSNLNFFPIDFDFDKKCILLSNQILKYYSTILHSKKFHFIICSCEFTDENLENYKKQIQKINSDVTYIRNEFSEELYNLPLSSTCEYLQNVYRKGTFEILNLGNLSKFLQNNEDLKDVIYNIRDDTIIEYLKGGKIDNNVFLELYEQYESKLKSKDFTNTIYEPYSLDLESDHKNGAISKGTLMMSSTNNKEGEIVEKTKRTKVYKRNINRALHGDQVYVQDDKIVGIYKRNKKVFVGTLIKIDRINQFYNIGIVRPIDRRFPDIEVLTQLSTDSIYNKVFVELLNWDENKTEPSGVIFKLLGKSGNFEDEIKAIMFHYSIDYFDKSWDSIVTSNAFNFNDPNLFTIKRAQDEILSGKRIDLRHLNVCSVDPKGCTDIDDALHCIDHGEYIEVGVHIADVSFYVKPGTFLDEQAKNRSTTVYLPDRRIDMLPPFLSADLCSLVENQERAAFSCVWKIDQNFNIIDTKIFKSLISSKAALSYEEAYEIIRKTSEQESNHNVDQFNLLLLLRISQKLRKQRFENGALALNSQDMYFDSKLNLKIKDSVPTHSMIEEFMLLANISIAKFILKHNPEYSLLRRHPLPSTIDLNFLDCTNSKTLNASLGKLDPDQQTIVKRIVTRSMQQALYFPSGDNFDFYHYGLAVEVYTHFTSPIRRYPDILVHRAVEYILENQYDKIDGLKEYVNNTSCSLMNFRHRNSHMASMMANELCLARAIENKIVESSVVSIKSNGIVVFVKEYGLESLIEIDPSSYKLFDIVKVEIVHDFEYYCVNRKFKIFLQS